MTHIKRIDESDYRKSAQENWLISMVGNNDLSIIVKEVEGSFPYKNDDIIENFMDFKKALFKSCSLLEGNLKVTCDKNLMYNVYVEGEKGTLSVNFYVLYFNEITVGTLNELLY